MASASGGLTSRTSDSAQPVFTSSAICPARSSHSSRGHIVAPRTPDTRGGEIPGHAPPVGLEPTTRRFVDHAAHCWRWRLSRAGFDATLFLRSAAAAGPRPDDHPAAALWWRILDQLPPPKAAQDPATPSAVPATRRRSFGGLLPEPLINIKGAHSACRRCSAGRYASGTGVRRRDPHRAIQGCGECCLQW